MIPYFELKSQLAPIGREVRAAIDDVLDSTWFVLGKQVRAFEEEFADYLGLKHAVGVASGTEAIELALKAVGVRRGHEVITVANTCVPTLCEIGRVLKPGGALFLNLPAYQWMLSSHDGAVQQDRRFTRRELRRLLCGASLKPVRMTHWSSLLLPLRCGDIRGARRAGTEENQFARGGIAGIARRIPSKHSMFEGLHHE